MQCRHEVLARELRMKQKYYFTSEREHNLFFLRSKFTSTCSGRRKIVLLFTVTVSIRIYYKYHFDREFINKNPSLNGNMMWKLHLWLVCYVICCYIVFIPEVKGLSWLFTDFIYNSSEWHLPPFCGVYTITIACPVWHCFVLFYDERIVGK